MTSASTVELVLPAAAWTGPASSTPDDYQAVLACQRGLISRRQMQRLGMSTDQISWRLRHHLSVVVPGVYRANRGPLSTEDRHLAALLLGGPRSVITGIHAVQHYGIAKTENPGRVDVLIPVNQAPRTLDWIRLRRSGIPDQHCRSTSLLRWVSPERAVAEAATWSSSQRLARKIIIEAAQRGIISPDDVAAWVEQLGRRNSVQAVNAIAEARKSVWSIPEADLVTLVSTSACLPEPWPNPVLRNSDGQKLITPDLWFDDVAMAVMVHSRAHHLGAEEWENTVSRDAELQALGIACLGITPTMIRDEPAAALKRIEATYLRTRGSGAKRPAVIATPRHT